MKSSLINIVATGILIGSIMLLNFACRSSEEKEYDVVIYGQTSAGAIAAVQAKRMDKTVVIVGSDKHLGGLSSGRLGATDIGNKKVIGGIPANSISGSGSITVRRRCGHLSPPSQRKYSKILFPNTKLMFFVMSG